MASSLQTIKAVIRQTVSGFGDDEAMTRAAALAFYTALSFAPMLVLSLWLVSMFDADLQTRLTEGLSDLVGEQAAGTADLVIENARDRPGVGNVAGLVSIGVTLFAASLVFTQLQQALNRIWGVRPQPRRAWLGWLRSRAQAAGLLLTLVLLLVVSFAISALIAVFIPEHVLFWRGIEAGMSFAVFVAVFACIYKVLPDALISWRQALLGAVLTAALFVAGKFGIGLYLDHSNVGGAYGPAGGIVVLLVWVYYSGIIVLLGAELTHAVAAARGVPILACEHAQKVQHVETVAPEPVAASTDADLAATQERTAALATAERSDRPDSPAPDPATAPDSRRHPG
ncbi:MAG: YihY/virulence factor BrkB family protein [Xanthomonadales bacterium]|nr:YihY/virulence factor BrkB family protein [Xanthomonadales bacterium]